MCQKLSREFLDFSFFFWNFISFISWSYLSFPKGFFPNLKEPLFGKCEIKVYFQHFTQEKCQIENQLNDIFMTKALNKANKLKYAFIENIEKQLEKHVD